MEDVFRRLVARTQLNAAVERATSRSSVHSPLVLEWSVSLMSLGATVLSVDGDIERDDAGLRGVQPSRLCLCSTVRLPPASGRTMAASPTTLSKEKRVNSLTP